MAYRVTNNKQNQRFEIIADGETAYLEYRNYKGDIALMHTLVPDSISGRGIASALAKHALEYARAAGQKVMVYCPFVAQYLKRHPVYDDLVDKK